MSSRSRMRSVDPNWGAYDVPSTADGLIRVAAGDVAEATKAALRKKNAHSSKSSGGRAFWHRVYHYIQTEVAGGG